MCTKQMMCRKVIILEHVTFLLSPFPGWLNIYFSASRFYSIALAEELGGDGWNQPQIYGKVWHCNLRKPVKLGKDFIFKF